MMPPKPVEKKFGIRKAVLLSLPVLIAIVVGGYSGELLGYEGFFWPGAIAWGLVILIIDYNFSIMEELSKLGWLGRVVLIMTSAIITSTVGDHIILKETVDRKTKEYFNEQIDSLKGKTILVSGLNQLNIDVNREELSMNDISDKIEAVTNEMIVECSSSKGGVGPSCNNLIFLKNNFESDLEKARLRFKEAKSRLDAAVDEGRLDNDKEKDDLINQRDNQHDIILEMKLLYKEIFSETTTTIFFFLFALMVICIETLPLLLKSGVTSRKIYEQRIIDWQRQCDAINLKKQQGIDSDKLRRSIILKNNRI